MLFSEADSITKLSPRASSEGSASLEDSGHVSGASTQENTPEHRRTDSLQSQASMASSKLSTLTDVRYLLHVNIVNIYGMSFFIYFLVYIYNI